MTETEVTPDHRPSTKPARTPTDKSVWGKTTFATLTPGVFPCAFFKLNLTTTTLATFTFVWLATLSIPVCFPFACFARRTTLGPFGAADLAKQE